MKTSILRRFYLFVFGAMALSPLANAQAQVAGDWIGAIDAGGSQLHLALHITAAKDGGLTATLDSVDQGALGIPVTTVTFYDSKLSLTVDAVNGSYEGTVNKDATEINGTWTQGQAMALNFKRGSVPVAAAPKPAAPSDIDGLWQGELDANGTKLRILFKIANTQDGLSAKLQSPDQSQVWIQANSVARSGNSLTISFNGISVVFVGKIDADLSSIDGSFTQMGNALPLVVKRTKE